MAKYIIKRLLVGAVTLLVLITITFFLERAIPGSPFVRTDDESPAMEKAYEELNAKYGLDKPLMEQYVIYLKGLAHGDLGDSLITRGRKVTDIIAESAPVTARLALTAFLFSMAVGITLGTLAAFSKRQWVTWLAMVVSTIGVSVPNFLIGLGLLLLFGVQLRWFPTLGLKTPLHYVLPTIALSLHPIAMVTRLTKSSMQEVMRQDYMTLARSKGSGKLKVIVLHGIKNAMLPVVTYAGPLIASLMTGSVVIESLFTIPGIGAQYVSSVNNRDYTLIMGLTIFMGFLIIVFNLLSDVVAAMVDPRIKVGK